MEIRPWQKLQESMPPLAMYEFEALKASIAEHGVLQHILLLPDGRIIDGYHRWKIDPSAPYNILDLDENTAFLLGLAMNSARRQLSPDQIKELRKAQREMALELRRNGMSQEKVAGILGVAQKTIDVWEGTSNSTDTNTCTPPDLRVSIPEKEQEHIYQRYEAGETQAQIASDYKATQQRISQVVKKLDNERQEQHLRESIKVRETEEDSRFRLITGDFAVEYKTLTPGSVDAIITDPPYSQQYLGLYNALAEAAQYVLKDSGLLLVLTGQSYLPEVLTRVGQYLTYHWTVAYLTPGGQSPQLWTKNVNSFWKPVPWFTKGNYTGGWVGDVVRSAVNDNDKTYHEWGQSESGFADLLGRFTKEGDLVLDPLMGAGTTGAVAVRLDRRFIGIDVSEEQVGLARGRILRELNEATLSNTTKQ